MQQIFASTHEPEIDTAAVQVDTDDLHANLASQAKAHAGAFAAQLLADFIKLEVVAAQFGNVHQPFHINGL